MVLWQFAEPFTIVLIWLPKELQIAYQIWGDLDDLEMAVISYH